MDNKAQVAFDYLILLTFVLALVVAISALVVHIRTLADTAINDALNIRGSLLQSLMR
jgi:uncharacterized protein (UPF0333 family)